MYSKNVHTYIATAQHMGIGIEYRHSSATEALRGLVEKMARNRKGDEQKVQFLKRLASSVMQARRGVRDWAGTTVSEGRSFVKLTRI